MTDWSVRSGFSDKGQESQYWSLAMVARKMGDFVLAATYVQEALTLFQAIGAKLETQKTEELLKQLQAQLTAA